MLSRKTFDRLFYNIITNPIKISSLVFLICFVLITGITGYYHYYSDRFRENLLVEAHGTLMDILLLGVFVVWLQQKGSTRISNERYIEEIDDFRKWDNEIAARKIRGNIRRLNSNGITCIDLNNCCLKGMDLAGVTLEESEFWGADLSMADMRDAILCNSSFEDANLSDINLLNSNLSGSSMLRVKIDDADLRGADFSKTRILNTSFISSDCEGIRFTEAELRGVCFRNANLFNSDFRAADLTDADLTGAILKEADLTEVQGLHPDQLSACETLWNAKLDQKILSSMNELHPELLCEPASSEDW